MWYNNQKETSFTTFLLSPAYLICSSISRINNLWTLQSYNRIPLSRLEYEQKMLFNPTKLRLLINNHLHQSTHSSVLFSVAGPAVYETIKETSTTRPQLTDFQLPSTEMQWQNSYLCPTDRNTYLHLLAGVNYSWWLQLMLLSAQCTRPFACITTPAMSLVSACCQLFGSAFRRTHLTDHLQHGYHSFEDRVDEQLLKRLITIPHHIAVDITKEKPYLLRIVGLAGMEKPE